MSARLAAYPSWVLDYVLMHELAHFVEAHHGPAFDALVVYTPTATPTAPCGACRQVLNEFGPAADVICVCDGTDVIRSTVHDLLPRAFGPENLG